MYSFEVKLIKIIKNGMSKIAGNSKKLTGIPLSSLSSLVEPFSFTTPV
jgi:hypothetical protein